MHHEGYADAEEVEHEHRCREDTHGENVRRWRDDGRDDEDDEDRVAQVSPQETCVHDAEKSQKHDQNGQFERDSEPENDGQEEVCVFIDFYQRVEVFIEREQEVQGAGEDPAVAEVRSGEKQAHRGEHEGGDEALFLLVESRGDEEPDLIQHEGRGDDAACHEADLQVHVEAVDGVVVVQHGRLVVLDKRVLDRPLHQAIDLLVKAIGDEEADDEVDDRMHEAATELLEVLEQAHAGQFGAFGNRAAGAIQEINHGGLGPARFPVFQSLFRLRLRARLALL